MQSIGPATSPPAVTSVTAEPSVLASPDVRPALPAAPATPRSADVAAFGKPSYAVFSVDEKSGKTRIAIYGADGRLVRLIPAGGVSEMLAQIASYRRLG